MLHQHRALLSGRRGRGSRYLESGVAASTGRHRRQSATSWSRSKSEPPWDRFT